MMKLQKKKWREEKPSFHMFVSHEEHERKHAVAAALLLEQYGRRWTQMATLRNPLKTPQTIELHIGRPSPKSPHITRFRAEDVNVRVVIAAGQTAEVPAPFADAAHLVDEDTGQVVGGLAPALRRLEKRGDGMVVDITPPLHESLLESVPVETKPRLRSR